MKTTSDLVLRRRCGLLSNYFGLLFLAYIAAHRVGESGLLVYRCVVVVAAVVIFVVEQCCSVWGLPRCSTRATAATVRDAAGTRIRVSLNF